MEAQTEHIATCEIIADGQFAAPPPQALLLGEIGVLPLGVRRVKHNVAAIVIEGDV